MNTKAVNMETTNCQTHSDNNNEIMEENVGFISLLMRDGDKNESILHIPILPSGNILYADIKDLDQCIQGIAYITSSGKRIKVGFDDKSKDQLRYIITYPIFSKFVVTALIRRENKNRLNNNKSRKNSL